MSMAGSTIRQTRQSAKEKKGLRRQKWGKRTTKVRMRAIENIKKCPRPESLNLALKMFRWWYLYLAALLELLATLPASDIWLAVLLLPRHSRDSSSTSDSSWDVLHSIPESSGVNATCKSKKKPCKLFYSLHNCYSDGNIPENTREDICGVVPNPFLCELLTLPDRYWSAPL